MKPLRRLQQYIHDSQTLPMKHAPIYLKVLAIVYQLLGRKLVATLLTTTSKCDGCKICVNKCPNHALTFRFKNLRRNNHCKGCLLCVYYCPNRAFELPLGRLIGVFLLLFLPYDNWISPLFGDEFVTTMPYLVRQLFLFLLWGIGYSISAFLFIKISFLLYALPVVKRIGTIPFVRKIRNKVHPAWVFPIYELS